MSKIALSGNASGTGVFTFASPNSNTDRTLDIPDASGTIDRLNRAGNVLQVVSATYSVGVTTSSSTYSDTGLTASITPSSTNSKILVLVNQQGCQKYGANTGLGLKLFRGATELAKFEGQLGLNSSTTLDENNGGCGINYLDSPLTTSSVTYKTQLNSRNNTGTVGVQADSATSTITLMEIAG